MSSVKKTNLTEEKNAVIGGMLYLVATPIGNLSDISERALKVLNEVDFIAAEDTRNSGLLLSRYGIPSKPFISYFEHNKRERGEVIAQRLSEGQSCALITDAGTPAISDPGEDIVRICAERNIPVTSIPGCCAAITALTLSALPTGRFVFEGFLSVNKAERRDRLKSLENEDRTIIFYEAPHKLKTTLSDLMNAFGESRKITLCRELTKLNEDIMRTTIGEAVKIYSEREPRGEYVLVVEGTSEVKKAANDYPDDITEHVNLLIEGGMSKMDAIKACAKARGVSKSVIYDEINIKKD